MSLADDQKAEFDAQLDRAQQRCLYGKRYGPAYDLARRVEALRRILREKEEGKADPELNCVERRYMLQTAGILLIGAITASKKLREVADALDAEQQEAAGQANILRAYEDCVKGRYPPTVAEVGECFVRCYVPTFAQLRDAFIKRFGEECLGSDYGIRKTVKVLGLPLSKAKRGRPVGARPVIHN